MMRRISTVYSDGKAMTTNRTNQMRLDGSSAKLRAARLTSKQRDDLERVLPIDELQLELTEKWILPRLQEIETELLDIRIAVDVELSERFSPDAVDSASSKFTKIYPEGYCFQITKRVLSEFERRNAGSPSEAGVAIASFRRAGGHFHRVWGILRDLYFQNALQIGSYYFDVANDTVDVAKPKVEFMPMAESGFRNVTSYEEFATILERYCGGTAFPNTHFPMLAPLMPVLWIDTNEALTIQSCIHFMMRMNLDSGFRAAERFLTQSPWAERTLPATMAERVERFKAETLPAKSRAPSGGVSSGMLLARCEEFRTNRSYSSPAFMARMIEWSSGVRLNSNE